MKAKVILNNGSIEDNLYGVIRISDAATTTTLRLSCSDYHTLENPLNYLANVSDIINLHTFNTQELYRLVELLKTSDARIIKLTKDVIDLEFKESIMKSKLEEVQDVKE